MIHWWRFDHRPGVAHERYPVRRTTISSTAPTPEESAATAAREKDGDGGEPQPGCGLSESPAAEIDYSRYAAATAAEIKGDARLLEAARFVEDFDPDPDVEYGWVFEYANKRWDEQLAIYQKLEDKASSVITWVGGGTGLFAVGVVSSVSEGKLVGWPALLILIPLAVALVSVVFAIIARCATEMNYWLPAVQDATEWAGFSKKGQTRRLVEWNLAIAYLKKKSRERATRINVSLWLAFSAVASLTVPLVAAVVAKWPTAYPPATIPHAAP